MDKQNQKFLQELYQWAKETFRYYESGMEEREVREWRDWEIEIENLLQKEGTQNEIIQVYHQGKKLIAMIRQEDSMRLYANHTLPPLPYAYNALEPYISETIMRLHHQEHHQSYVDGLNEAERNIYLVPSEEKLLRHWLLQQAFHGSGHYLHSIFWQNLTPNSTKYPIKTIAKEINKSFGSFEKFKKLFENTARSLQGPGWAMLAYDPMHDRLLIESIDKHQLEHIPGMTPLLVLDMWEHAYYLQYDTDKDEYIASFWHVINWNDVNSRLVKAKSNK